MKSTWFENVRAIRVVGQGATGTVFLARKTEEDGSGEATFALKVVKKSSVRRSGHMELEVLSRTSAFPHPFLPCLLPSYCVDEPQVIAWASPFCPGGDLHSLRHRQCDRVFSPSVARFYLAEILAAIEHLHMLGIVHRDLKPENVLVQSSGHVTLTDFDLSRSLKKPDHSAAVRSPALEGRKKNSARVSPARSRGGERAYSFVGTDEYMAPEMVRGEGHTFMVDWWAFGVLAYEMVYGATPFKGRNRKETFWNVVHKEPVFIGARTHLTDLIERLLQKDPLRRLGYLCGATEIKAHPFFGSVNWDFLNLILRPPYIPTIDDYQYQESSNVSRYFQNMITSQDSLSLSFTQF